MDTTIAYLAGFMDGEGNIRIARAKGASSYVLRVSATQVDPAPLSMLKAEFGGYLYHRKRTARRPDGYNRQDIWDWVLIGPDAARALKALLPYLVVKRSAADLGIAFQNLKDARNRRPLDAWQIAERESFFEAMAVRTNQGAL